MVKLSVVHAANAEYVKQRSLVVVSAGGTSGIGQSTIYQLATTAANHGSQGLRVYIVGRKQAVVESMIKELSAIYNKGEYIFVHGKDLSLLKEVDGVCKDITEQERERVGEKARIDLLLLSQAIFTPFDPRSDTSEGLDINMSLMYYSRMRFIDRLLPLLLARPTSDDPAHVISIYAAGAESMGTLYADDLSLRDPKHFSFSNVRTNIVYMKKEFFEHIAKDHAGKISLAHLYPGLVITPAFAMLTKPPMPLWVRLVTPVALPLAKITVATPIPESGQRTLFAASSHFPARSEASSDKIAKHSSITMATDGVLGGGAYSCGRHGDANKLDKTYTKLEQDGFYEKVWAHTQDVFKTIESGNVFKN